MTEPDRCQRCAGAGHIDSGGPFEQCPDCRGIGWAQPGPELPRTLPLEQMPLNSRLRIVSKDDA